MLHLDNMAIRDMRILRESQGFFQGHGACNWAGNSSAQPHPRIPVLRALFIIGTVAAVAAGLNRLEHVHSQISTVSPAWVRTVDGWEPSSVLRTMPAVEYSPAVHPALVASFQLGASVFVLLAFPYRKSR
jgi:hypothetical protein